MAKKKETETPKNEEAVIVPSFEALKAFRDKYTREVYIVGSLYEGTDERVKELQLKGYLGEAHEPGQTE